MPRLEGFRYDAFESAVKTEPELRNIFLYGENVEYHYLRRFVFSSMSPDNKYTCGCVRCLAFITTGTHRRTDETISALAHISPSMLNPAFSGQFEDEFKKFLTRFASLTYPQTRDSAIAGGLLGTLETDGFWQRFIAFPYEQFRMERGISKLVNRILEVPIRRLTPPKSGPESSDIYLSTKTGRVIVIEESG